MENCKGSLYKTARAKIGCAMFKSGDYVSVQLYHVAENGTKWYKITKSQNGNLPYPVTYPEHHLENFTL